jgi:hypothetical protein
MIRRTVSGDPISIGAREIVPVVEIAGSAPGHPGRGRDMSMGLFQAMPIAVIERSGEGEHRIVIPDVTGQAVRNMVAAGVIVWVVLWIVRRRWSHDR